VSTPGEDAHSNEAADEPIAWQHELDVAIDDIDSRLKHPRRRVTDEPPAPQNVQPAITSEVIDEIAWRVADLLKRDGAVPAPGPAVAAAISKTVASPPPRAPQPAAPPLPEPRRLPHGIAMTIRVRKPFFRLPWPFRRRRKRQAMIMFSDYRIS
jgi:hypothetical protein